MVGGVTGVGLDVASGVLYVQATGERWVYGLVGVSGAVGVVGGLVGGGFIRFFAFSFIRDHI